MLYLPPHWGHDGVAVGGDCMTCSVGFRVPDRDELARELLLRLADESGGDAVFYRDPGQPAAASPAAVPPGLLDFARRAVQRRLSGDDWLPCLLGEILSEPKPQVSFDGPGRARGAASAVVLAPRTRMLHDARCVYINGESFEVRGRDGTLARRLADERRLSADEVARLSGPARAALDTWIAQGWASAAD